MDQLKTSSSDGDSKVTEQKSSLFQVSSAISIISADAARNFETDKAENGEDLESSVDDLALRTERLGLDERAQDQEIARDLTEEAVTLVANPNNYYSHYALNFVIDAAVANNLQVRLIRLGEDQNLEENLQQFRDSNQIRVVMPIRPTGREHFTGLFIERIGVSFRIVYIDPVGSGAILDIPENIRNTLNQILGIPADQIISTTNRIQHSRVEQQVRYLTNVHCGPFTGFILSGLALGNIRVEGNRLALETDQGWQDISDLSKSQSQSFGEKLRQHDLTLLTGSRPIFPQMMLEEYLESKFEHDLESLTTKMDRLPKAVATADEGEYYRLTRSDSDMSQYSDLVEEMLSDQIGLKPEFVVHKEEYKKMDVIIRNLEIVEIDGKIEKLKSDNKSLGQRASKRATTNKITLAEKKSLQAANYEEKARLEAYRQCLPEEKERDYTGEDAIKRMHLFRGKNLNNQILDLATGALRERTKKEKEEYVTRKYPGKIIYSDGTSTIRNDQDRVIEVEKKVRTYIRGVKAKNGEEGKENKALFGSDTSYTAAVAYLMRITGLRGNPVVATTKFPWVACEYMAGQMGGAAGGDRDTAFGYQKDGKPVNRVMGNGFAISLSLADYRTLRDSNDLIDVNLDIIGRATECNRMIEEVTFASKIEGKHVKGSIPMVLPRLDRNWGSMSREKHIQYLRVFNLDKYTYEKFQKLLIQSEYPLGQLTEHLIQHHGNLLKDLAIITDRRSGYQGKFVATQSSSEKGAYHGDLTDLNNGGKRLATRSARTGSSEKSSPYLTREKSALSANAYEQDWVESVSASSADVGTPLAKKYSSSKKLSDAVVEGSDHELRLSDITKQLEPFSPDKTSRQSTINQLLDILEDNILESDISDLSVTELAKLLELSLNEEIRETLLMYYQEDISLSSIVQILKEFEDEISESDITTLDSAEFAALIEITTDINAKSIIAKLYNNDIQLSEIIKILDDLDEGLLEQLEELEISDLEILAKIMLDDEIKDTVKKLYENDADISDSMIVLTKFEDEMQLTDIADLMNGDLATLAEMASDGEIRSGVLRLYDYGNGAQLSQITELYTEHKSRFEVFSNDDFISLKKDYERIEGSISFEDFDLLYSKSESKLRYLLENEYRYHLIKRCDFNTVFQAYDLVCEDYEVDTISDVDDEDLDIYEEIYSKLKGHEIIESEKSDSEEDPEIYLCSIRYNNEILNDPQVGCVKITV